MNYLMERVAYLKGLAEGLALSENSKEGKVLVEIVNVLQDFADTLDETLEIQDDLQEYIELMDEDLSDVEEIVFSDYDDYDEDWDCDCDCDCDECDFDMDYGDYSKYSVECDDSCEHCE